MKIYQNIKKQAAIGSCRPKRGQLGVVDTVESFWRQINQENLQAKVLDASSLLDTFSGIFCHKHFVRQMEFGHLSPLTGQILWVEAADREMSASLAASLAFSPGDSQAIDLARQYGITRSFTWICRARSYLKKFCQPTLPLKWEWVEYIDAAGGSVGSLLRPLVLPEYLERLLEPELREMDLIQHHLCAFIANLGLYTVELINSSKASIKPYTANMVSCQAVKQKEITSWSGANWT